MRIVAGTRGSPLALAQSQQILDSLRRLRPDLEVVVMEVRTEGDIAGDVPLAIMPRGLFAKELEVALKRREIDIAVHSFKDLPTELEDGFVIAAIGPREDPRDVLVAPGEAKLDELPIGARLGTSSPRRVAQLKAYRPDLELIPIRGNVGTRIRKAHGPDFDGVVVAAAGVHRLGFQDQVTDYLSPDICLPAVGQGALALEVRAGDRASGEIVSLVDHAATRVAVEAEMGVLRKLGGGCKTPIAAFAELQGEDIWLRAMVASTAGDQILKAEVRGPRSHPADLGFALAQELLGMGAGPLLEDES